MTHKVERRIPTVTEYNTLRQLSGWPTFTPALAEKGLANSLFSVCVSNEHGLLVGFGRVVGDGAINLYIQDVLVHPDHQRMGIGKLVMTEIMNYIDQTGGKNTNIGLMCAKGKEKFYSGFGFIVRPDEKFGAGMTKIKT
jgi:ribosomal protein S18 acetylase RimI-like enzyme